MMSKVKSCFLTCKSKKSRGVLFILTFVMCLTSILSFPTQKTFAAETKQSVLNYISGFGSTNSFISGQYCGYPNEVTSLYTQWMDGLNTDTGKYPAIMCVDYEGNKRYTASELTTVNNKIISHWNSKGLVTINYHAYNPWNNGNSWNTSNVILADLVNPTKPIYTTWHNYLDTIANSLMELKNAGVIVLWRPFHEMNGAWFWWGAKNQTDYKNLWIDMYNYFNSKGLNNLIWVYSAAMTSGSTVASVQTDYYYPGSQYVDMVGYDFYQDSIPTWMDTDVNKLVALGKPFAMTETGPLGSTTVSKTFNNNTHISLKDRYPQITYFSAWGDWDNANGSRIICSIRHSTNAYSLITSSRVISRDEVDITTPPVQGGFVKGINFNGNAVTIDGNTWLSYSSALTSGLNINGAATYSGARTWSPTPVNTDYQNMLNSVVYKSGGNVNLTQTIANGNYQIYIWSTENYTSNSRSFNLNLENNQVASNIGSMANNAWTKYGPYNVTVADGTLNIDLIRLTGDPQIAGIAIFSNTQATNLVQNPGFETGTGTNWALWNYSVVSGNANSGTYSGRLSSGAGSFSQTITGLLPNTTYTLKGWCKIQSGDVVYLGVKNYGGTETSQQFTSTSYAEKTVTFTTGANNTTAEIYYFKGSGTGTSYCDDASVTKN